MKTSHLAAVSAALACICALVPMRSSAQTSPSVPVGSLTAFPTVVRTGTKPTLTWSINYPSVVVDYVTVTPPATLTPKQNLYCDIRILGQGVTASSNNSTFTYVPTEAQVKYDTGSYGRIFYGINTAVNPNTIVYTRQTLSGKKLKFGGRYFYNNSWSTLYTSDSGTQNVRTLVNGSTPPSVLPAYNAPSLESFLRPYLNSAGKIQIGPMDVIIFMELTHTDSQMSDPGYDLQDMVILVTFRTS